MHNIDRICVLFCKTPWACLSVRKEFSANQLIIIIIINIIIIIIIIINNNNNNNNKLLSFLLQPVHQICLACRTSSSLEISTQTVGTCPLHTITTLTCGLTPASTFWSMPLPTPRPVTTPTVPTTGGFVCVFTNRVTFRPSQPTHLAVQPLVLGDVWRKWSWMNQGPIPRWRGGGGGGRGYTYRFKITHHYITDEQWCQQFCRFTLIMAVKTHKRVSINLNNFMSSRS